MGKAVAVVAAIIAAIFIIGAIGHLLLTAVVAVLIFGAGYETKALKDGTTRRLHR